MTNTIYLLVFLLSLTLSSCGGAEHSATDTGSASFGLMFEEASAPAAMKAAPSAAPADICSSYGIATISADIGNASTEQPGLLYVAASGGPWPCSAHQGKITNVPPGSNYTLKLYAYAMNSNINIIWMGETTGVTINAGQDTNVGSISMTYMGNDTTPPTVSASTPTGTNVPVTSPITVTFSEAMAASTIDSTTFTLKNGSVAVSGSVSYNSTTRTATFTPTSSLSNSVIYSATVTTDVTDMAANKMLSLYAWDFTTEAPPGSAPTTPTGVSATAADKQVTVSWPAVTGATSYNIYWSTTTGVTKTNGTLITGATSPYTHTALTNGTIYYYVVTAVNGYGESGESGQAFATPQAAPYAPSGVSATAADKQVTIGWTAVTGVTSYNIYWSTTTGVTKTNGTKIAGATNSYIHTALTNGMTYYYVVTAVNSSGESVESNQISATPIPASTTLVSGLSSPSYGIAIDSASVYWSNSSTVKKVGITGGTVTTLASGLSQSNNIAVDSTSIYWTEFTGGTVKKIAINGGAITTLASGLSSPYQIAIDSAVVYWTEYGAGSVKKIDKNGGIVTTLASGLISPSFIAVDSTSVYWIDNSSVKKINRNGGAVITLASGLISPPQGIALDSASIYWTEADTVKKVGITGGTVTTLASGLDSPLGITVDSTNVYWTEYNLSGGGAGKVDKVSVNGGPVTTIASGLINPSCIVLDSTNVYWTNWNNLQTVAK